MSRHRDSPAKPLRVLSIDPGRDKCGVAVVDARDGVLARGVIPTTVVAAVVRDWARAHRAALLLVGGGTGSREVRRALVQVDLPMQVVPEVNTTRRARSRYFAEHPPRAWWRRLCIGLQQPPMPVDDYAAILIAEDFLAGAGAGRPGPPGGWGGR